MPEETSPSDRYLAEIDRLLGLSGRERRWALAAARRRLAALRALERKGGAGESEAEERALARLGAPAQAADELRERAHVARARIEAQFVLAAFVPIALAMVAIVEKVIEIRAFRNGGGIGSGANTDWQNFFHHHPGYGVWLPPRYLTAKLIVSGAFVVVALVLAESALAFTRHRHRLSAALTLSGGAALVAAVAVQVAFAFEWNRLQQPHGAWLFAAITVEIGTVAILAVFLARPARACLPSRLLPLASAPMFVLLALAPLLFVSARSGYSSTNLCPDNDCSTSSDEIIAYTGNHEVNVDLHPGPAGAQGTVALKGRRLAVAVEAWRSPGSSYPPRPGSVGLEVWEGRWPAFELGPCGKSDSPFPEGALVSDYGLSPRTSGGCQAFAAASYGRATWKEVARIKGVKTGALAAAYRSNGTLAVAYSRPGGVWLAEAPYWRPRRLLGTRAASVRIAPLPGGDLALAAIVAGPGGSKLELSRSHGDRWSRPVSFAARPKLSMVSGGSQVALLFRDSQGRLVLERRTATLALLEHRSFGARALGAIGNLRGGEIGAAVAVPLSGLTLLLKTYRVGHARLEPLTSERFRTSDPGGNTAAYALDLDRTAFAGVVETGFVVRALFGGLRLFHTNRHVALSIFLRRGRLAFASSWPRWVVLKQWPNKAMSFGKTSSRWTDFTITVSQPPEQQLLNEAGVNPPNGR